VRDLKGRYVGSVMGFFWSIVHPLVLLACYTFVFQVVFNVKPISPATDNFAIFLFCGIMPWLYFQETVTRSCNCIIENSNLIRKTLFSSEILPVSHVISALVTHLLGMLILLSVLGFTGLLNWTVIFFPLYLFLMAVFSLGLGWLVSSLQVFLRDTVQVVTVLLVFWFWFTPIFYSVEQIPLAFQQLAVFNPLTHVVEGYRLVLLEGKIPDLDGVGILTAFALVSFLFGGYVFRKTKREFADVL
jgi:ABC-type polysaccharide/polyol phosphate export permease